MVDLRVGNAKIFVDKAIEETDSTSNEDMYLRWTKMMYCTIQKRAFQEKQTEV